jgi:hypothetical protein
MLRTLRKHNKWILVVGGSLLMVTFLISGTANQLQPDPSKQTVATVRGDKVTAREMLLAMREFEVLKELVSDGFMQNLGDMESGEEWFLISQEAIHAGLVGGASDGMDWIPSLGERRASLYVTSIPQQRLAQEMQEAGSREAYEQQVVSFFTERLKMLVPSAGAQAGLNEQQVGMALAKLRGVERLYQLTMAAPRLSTARLALEASNVLDVATINAVILPAEPLAASLPEPTPEEMQAQFMKHRAVSPGGPGLGFGYLQPPRVKIGWMMIDRAAVASAIRLDPIAVNKYWQQNRAMFPGEYAAERSKIEDVLRNERAESVLAEMDRVLKARVNQATRALDIDGARKVLPADWDAKKPTLGALAADVVGAVKDFNGVTVEQPGVTIMDTRWIPLAELDLLPGVGSAVYTSATAQMTLAQLIARSQELADATELDLQARVPFASSPLIDAAGNRYYIEILDARRESVPESIDEVRDQVAQDARIAKAFERLSAEAAEFRVMATLQGLDAVASAFEARFPDTDVTPMNQILLSRGRVISFLAQQLNDEGFRNAVMDAAATIPATVEMDDRNVDARTIAKPVAATRSVIVAQITHREPVTVETVRSVRPQDMMTLVMNERMRTLGSDPTFSLDAVSKRLDFVNREPGRRKEVEAKPSDAKPGEGKDAPAESGSTGTGSTGTGGGA